ncbi:hypothetical protein [Sodalis glossinidius]|uniref:hypothetical protein n=1 Tax=Sodalis glossinidius TaxID=63612 RepID=UPI00031AEF12|nr:hypothetical protein [Sodalis glossinidius]
MLENPGQDNHDRRVIAFINEMKTAFSDTKLVALVATNQDPSKVYNAVLSMLQAHPNLAVLFMP